MHINNISQKAAAFILHKPFHPGSYQTLERVWIAEQKQAELERKQKQLQEARAQESKLDELRSALHKSRKANSEQALQWVSDAAQEDEAGLKLPLHLIEEISANKLDWLYINHSSSATTTAKDQPSVRAEDILRTKDKLNLPAAGTQADQNEADQEALRSGQIAAAYRSKLSEADMLRKIREDPLFQIKQAELRHQKALEKNPLLADKRRGDFVDDNDRHLPSKRYRSVDNHSEDDHCGGRARQLSPRKYRRDKSRSPSPPRGNRRVRPPPPTGPIKPDSWDESQYLGPPPEMNESLSRRIAATHGNTQLRSCRNSSSDQQEETESLEAMTKAAAERRQKARAFADAAQAKDRQEAEDEERRRNGRFGEVPKFLIDAQNEAIDRLVTDRRRRCGD